MSHTPDFQGGNRACTNTPASDETPKEPKCKSPITKPATAESICEDVLSKARKIAETWKKEGKTKEELIREFGHMLDVLDAGKL